MLHRIEQSGVAYSEKEQSSMKQREYVKLNESVNNAKSKPRERPTHSITISSLCYVHLWFVVLVVSHLGFEDGNLVLIAPVPGHCFPLIFHHQSRDSSLVLLQPSGQVLRILFVRMAPHTTESK